jgi:hypothetical protein
VPSWTDVSTLPDLGADRPPDAHDWRLPGPEIRQTGAHNLYTSLKKR